MSVSDQHEADNYTAVEHSILDSPAGATLGPARGLLTDVMRVVKAKARLHRFADGDATTVVVTFTPNHTAVLVKPDTFHRYLRLIEGKGFVELLPARRGQATRLRWSNQWKNYLPTPDEARRLAKKKQPQKRVTSTGRAVNKATPKAGHLQMESNPESGSLESGSDPKNGFGSNPKNGSLHPESDPKNGSVHNNNTISNTLSLNTGGRGTDQDSAGDVAAIAGQVKPETKETTSARWKALQRLQGFDKEFAARCVKEAKGADGRRKVAEAVLDWLTIPTSNAEELLAAVGSEPTPVLLAAAFTVRVAQANDRIKSSPFGFLKSHIQNGKAGADLLRAMNAQEARSSGNVVPFPRDRI